MVQQIEFVFILEKFVKKAIHYHASAIILVHNHPSGNTTPSQADIQQTQNLKEALSTIEVKLHDHIIISSNGYYSFKTNELLSPTSL
jgi:DNA repair protein RadC